MTSTVIRAQVARLAGEDGISLVEMMVTLLILGVVFSGMAMTHITSLAAIHAGESLVNAVQLGNEAVEELQKLDWQHLGLATDDSPGPTFEGYPVVTVPSDPAVPQHERSVTRGGKAYDIRTVVVRVDSSSNGGELRGLIVDVSWNDGEHSVRAEARRAGP